MTQSSFSANGIFVLFAVDFARRRDQDQPAVAGSTAEHKIGAGHDRLDRFYGFINHQSNANGAREMKNPSHSVTQRSTTSGSQTLATRSSNPG